MVYIKEKENIFIMMEIFIKDRGKTVRKMVGEYQPTQMEDMRDSM